MIGSTVCDPRLSSFKMTIRYWQDEIGVCLECDAAALVDYLEDLNDARL